MYKWVDFYVSMLWHVQHYFQNMIWLKAEISNYICIQAAYNSRKARVCEFYVLWSHGILHYNIQISTMYTSHVKSLVIMLIVWNVLKNEILSDTVFHKQFLNLKIYCKTYSLTDAQPYWDKLTSIYIYITTRQTIS